VQIRGKLTLSQNGKIPDSRTPIRNATENTSRIARIWPPAVSKCRRVPLPIFIAQHVRRMRGGAQSHLMRAADGNFYVVKFQNNPQHGRVLVNEWMGTRIAERLGLPVTPAEIVEVGEWLIRKTPELHVQLGGSKVPCAPGLQFGSRYVIGPMDGQVLDYMPEALLRSSHVRNLEVFAGALAFDKWTCNGDSRQMVFWRRGRERKYTATLIDQGYCFNAGEWSFPDSPLRGVYGLNAAYAGITGWTSFEPWLARIENLEQAFLGELAGAVPPEWYAGDWDALEALIARLVQRRRRVRRLIAEFRDSTRKPFPNWNEAVAGPAQESEMA
jgi:HipA-like protein